MTCPQMPAEDLVAWIDGETDVASSARVAAHVASCPVCRREAAALRESGALLLRLPAMEPSQGFAARVAAAVRTDSERAAPRGRLRFLHPRRVAVAAAVLVGISAGAWLLTSTSRDSGDVLTAREEEALAADLAVIANLDALQSADAAELARLVEDLDVLDGFGGDPDGG